MKWLTLSKVSNVIDKSCKRMLALLDTYELSDLRILFIYLCLKLLKSIRLSVLHERWMSLLKSVIWE